MFQAYVTNFLCEWADTVFMVVPSEQIESYALAESVKKYLIL